MENKKIFPVIIEESSDGYFVAKVPSLPGCHTQAKTLNELKKRIREAILVCLEVAKTNPRYREMVKVYSYEPKFIALEMIEL